MFKKVCSVIFNALFIVFVYLSVDALLDFRATLTYILHDSHGSVDIYVLRSEYFDRNVKDKQEFMSSGLISYKYTSYFSSVSGLSDFVMIKYYGGQDGFDDRIMKMDYLLKIEVSNKSTKNTGDTGADTEVRSAP
jgi:hypothetical protein